MDGIMQMESISTVVYIAMISRGNISTVFRSLFCLILLFFSRDIFSFATSWHRISSTDDYIWLLFSSKFHVDHLEEYFALVAPFISLVDSITKPDYVKISHVRIQRRTIEEQLCHVTHSLSFFTNSPIANRLSH